MISSILVITIVMGGQQIASIGKITQVQTQYLQFPLAAANAMILLAGFWLLALVFALRGVSLHGFYKLAEGLGKVAAKKPA